MILVLYQNFTDFILFSCRSYNPFSFVHRFTVYKMVLRLLSHLILRVIFGNEQELLGLYYLCKLEIVQNTWNEMWEGWYSVSMWDLSCLAMVLMYF